MFDVMYKDEDNSGYLHHRLTVYDVSYDSNGYPKFLIYCDGQWKRESAKHFRPWH